MYNKNNYKTPESTSIIRDNITIYVLHYVACKWIRTDKLAKC